MTDQSANSVALLLGAIHSGDSGAADRLFALVYDELRALAGHIFRDQQAEHTLQPTALVHEVWIKLREGVERVDDRVHFFRLAALAMRQVLADHARGQRRLKRGGGAEGEAGFGRVTIGLDEMAGAPGLQLLDLVDFDDSLRQLESLNERHARVVELRMLGGLTIDETAQVLGVSHGTVESDWSMARAWLRREVNRD